MLDFGLAKLVEEKNKSVLGLEDSSLQQSQTAKGMILGTVNYMSPEQAKGERVDERTDIFSLGVVIYEMLAGRTPFQGDSTPETFANLINQEPPTLSRFAVNVPAELQRTVSKTLRKDREARYQTMKGLLADLRELRENLTLEEKLERQPAPDAQATVQMQATTGDANKQTAQTQDSVSPKLTRRQIIFASAVILLIIAAVAVPFYLMKDKTMQMPQRELKMMMVTNSGKAEKTVISPDGKYISTP